MSPSSAATAAEPDHLVCDLTVSFEPLDDPLCGKVDGPPACAGYPHFGSARRPLTERFIGRVVRRPAAHSGETSS